MKELVLIPGCRVERVVHSAAAAVTLVARVAADGAVCPACRTPSRAPHSTYIRRPADLPALGRAVRVELKVRRFYCRSAHCPRQTFVEHVPGLLEPRARRTRRLAGAQCAAAVDCGAEAAARLLARLAMPASADTLLRLVRRAPLPKREAAHVLGVDDWALKKGQTYGTILVDLEAHRVVDLLPDRTGTTLARWLRAQPQIAVVTRDRSTEYTRAITPALPNAVQVADRWHLLLNARQVTERWLATVRGRLRHLPAAAFAEPTRATMTERTEAFPRSHVELAARAATRAHWHTRYDEVRRRHAAGETLQHIGAILGLARSTVRRFASAPTFPEHRDLPIAASRLDPFLAHLSTRHADGCENGLQLWREIQALGYTGHSRQVHRWLQTRRRVPAPTQPVARREAAAAQRAARVTAPPRLPSPRQLAWLVCRLPEELTAADAAVVGRIARDAEVARVIPLVRRFVALVRSRTPPAGRVEAFEAWLAEARTCGIRTIETFAAGLQQDGPAVRAALTTPWSNAQAEGHVTKLKLLKRQAYGRAKFDLLRRRVLLAA
jgi:transposase